MIGRAFRVTVSATAPRTMRVDRASPSRSASGREEPRSRRGTGPATGDASSRRRRGAPAAVRGAARAVAACLEGSSPVARRAPNAGLATACSDSRPDVSSTPASARRPRSARTMSPPAAVGLVDETTSSPPGSPAGSAAVTAGSSLHVGAAAAGGTACEAAAANGGCAGCSTRWTGGAGCGCAGGGAAVGAGAGAGATTLRRSGRNASGSR